MDIGTAIILATLVALNVAQLIMFFQASKPWKAALREAQKQNQELFNRLMSRNFSDFAAGTTAMTSPVARANVEQYLNQYQVESEQKQNEPEDDGLGMSVI